MLDTLLRRRRAPRAARAARVFALAALLAPAALRAQRAQTTLDVGATSMRYADSVSASGVAMTPAVLLAWPRATLGATGTLSQFGSGWSTQGVASLSVFTPSAGPLVGELEGTAGGSAHRDGSRTGQTMVLARAHLLGTTRGVWGGGGVGRTWDGGVWRSVAVAEAGAWANVGRAMLVATVAPAVVDDTITYTDAQLAVRWELSRLELGVTGGLRSGQRLPALESAATSWGSASATAWLGPHLALVASAGSYPVDFTQGFPGGRFASLGVRLGSHDASAPTRGKRSPNAEDNAVRHTADAVIATVTAFRLDSSASGCCTLRVQARAASAVEIAGDFTDWQPLRLRRDGSGWWTTPVAMGRGAHQVNVRVDGGAWIVPPGLTVITDEFGGSAGLLSVR